jgi:hypothetical protein
MRKGVRRRLKNKNLLYLCAPETEVVAQLVRASDCGSEGRGFETRLPPLVRLRIPLIQFIGIFFIFKPR